MLVVVLGLAGCTGGGSGRTTATTRAEPLGARPLVARTESQFQADLDALRGRVVVVNFWASWCVPCVGEAEVLGQLRRKGVKIEAIAVRDRPEAIAAFLARNGDPYERIGADPQSNVQISLGSSGVPETFVVDGKGVIRHQYIGPLTAANVPGLIEQLKALR